MKELQVAQDISMGIKKFRVFHEEKPKRDFIFLENKNQIFIYDFNILILKNFLDFRTEETIDPFPFFFLSDGLVGNISSKKIINLFNPFRKKTIFSLGSDIPIRVWGNLEKNKNWAFFFKKKMILRIININCFIELFFNFKLVGVFFDFSRDWIFQIGLPAKKIKKIIAFNESSKNATVKKVNLIHRKSIMSLKISKLVVMVDISSRRILCKLFFYHLEKDMRVLDFKHFIKIFWIENNKCKKKTKFFLFSKLKIPSLLLSNEKKFYWEFLIKFNNRFFWPQRRKKKISSFVKISLSFENLKPKKFCTGLKIWVRKAQENWGTYESNFFDINCCEPKCYLNFQFIETEKKTNIKKLIFNKKQPVFLKF